VDEEIETRRQRTSYIDRAIIAAVVTGILVIIGAVVGGKVSNSGAKQVEKARIAFERTQEQRSARGAGRLLVRELTIPITYVQAMLDMDRWMRTDRKRFRIDMRPEDMKSIAASVTGDEWGYIIVALGDAESVDLLMANRVKLGHQLGRHLSEAERLRLEKNMGTLQQAIRALADVANAPKD
jgi:hypothetical protein